MTARPLPLLTVPDATWWADNVPCRTACPVHTDAGAYVAAIADGDFARAYRIARAPNPFPSICGRVCAAPCEARCRRGAIDAPVAIRALKRVVSDRHGVLATGDDALWHEPTRTRRPSSGRRVAVVGGGPAGLACAHDLRLAGHAVVLFESGAQLGGMMVLGIPSFRLPRPLLEAEIAAIVSLGVEVRLGTRVGRDVAFESVEREFDAVFVASGTGVGRMLDVPGRELEGVTNAVAFLAQANAGALDAVGDHVVVVGGGSTAFDAARMALRANDGAPADTRGATKKSVQATLDVARAARRSGVREVTIVSLESRSELAAEPDELREAEREGIHLVHRKAVTRIEGAGRVASVALAPVRRLFSPDGRFAPDVDRAASPESLPCDAVIFAVGQEADTTFLPEYLVRHGLVATDPATLRTSSPKVWAGGDVASGPRFLIDAIADGKRAAAGIDAMLRGDDARATPGDGVRLAHATPWRRLWSDYDETSRTTLPTASSADRAPDAEVEGTLSYEGAVREAHRCLRCHANVTLRGERCVLCGLCADVCPERCIALHAVGDGRTTLSLDEGRCIRCGLCVARCPTEALTMVEAIFEMTHA